MSKNTIYSLNVYNDFDNIDLSWHERFTALKTLRKWAKADNGAKAIKYIRHDEVRGRSNLEPQIVIHFPDKANLMAMKLVLGSEKWWSDDFVSEINDESLQNIIDKELDRRSLMKQIKKQKQINKAKAEADKEVIIDKVQAWADKCLNHDTDGQFKVLELEKQKKLLNYEIELIYDAMDFY